MSKETITLEWEGVLRLMAADDEIKLLGSDDHDFIGLSVQVLATPASGPIPMEFSMTAQAAAGLLAMLRDLELDGKLPRNVVSGVKTTRQ